MEKYIISSSHLDSGLCNRIKSLVSTMRLNEKLNRKILICWPKNYACGTIFSDLFSNKFEIIGKEKLNFLLNNNLAKKYDSDIAKIDYKKPYLVFEDWRLILFPGEVERGFAKICPNKNGNNIDHEYERIPARIKISFIKELNKLKFNEEITDKIKLFLKKYKLNNFIGIHARRTDYLLNFKGKISTDEKFFNRMDEILKNNPQTMFFLATDSKKTEKLFKDKYPKKIITFPKNKVNRDDPYAIKEALIELLLLSKTKHILGSYLSTFTEMAWWFSGCKAKVEIIGIQSARKNNKVNDPTNFILKIRNNISSLIHPTMRNSSIFRSFLRVLGKWG